MEGKKCGCGCGTKSKTEMNTDLKKEAKTIVKQVEGYTKTDRDKKAKDLEAAFAEKKPAAKTTKTVAKPAAKKTAAKPAAKKTAAKPAAKKPAAGRARTK